MSVSALTDSAGTLGPLQFLSIGATFTTTTTTTTSTTLATTTTTITTAAEGGGWQEELAWLLCGFLLIGVLWKQRARMGWLLGSLFGLLCLNLFMTELAKSRPDWVLPVLILIVLLWNLFVAGLESKKTSGPLDGEGTEFDATGVYTDLSYPLEKAFLYFAVQTMLISTYLGDSIQKMVDANDRNTEYLGGALVIQLFVLVQSDQDFPWRTWILLWRSRGRVKQQQASGYQLLDVGLFEIVLRSIMSFLANMIYSKALVLTLPTVLMGSSSGIDFVKDAFAVTFISTLDSKESCNYIIAPEEEDIGAEGAEMSTRSNVSLTAAPTSPAPVGAP
eukprot:TRINITY_DN9319_c0_g1_i2.p1 TRINITY_DN9319_c0_g1~~TRINITY_DN9319_c0_g1_i2.p1  ORF type:complete len:333 (+),score=34.96 TRINITY_DN9319_c0_g1_i2:95-1093(+)